MTVSYTLGAPDAECRYPVLLRGNYIGLVFRWHRAWFAIPAGITKADGTEHEIRISSGATGKDAAAQYLCDEFDAGRIAPQQKAPKAAHGTKAEPGPAPLLHRRMNHPRNRAAALIALRGLVMLRWTPLGGYPGADNPWLLRCQLCGWIGVKYWSHLRGRKGAPPSPFRHPGCTGRQAV
ncbi:hypothetical protein [Streptomyces nitrosporeus]|uniref:hypothetical protein n=1 Tax=Streptomyces nitrosporeus TaxID=28894 RepID=UPI00167E79DD|nr:hypothetical protein [Streptomyces nitrosporeus]GGZ29420.1 hypothetical protein GCM10010327_69630 [Streptomyces nitrosporeus]